MVNPRASRARPRRRPAVGPRVPVVDPPTRDLVDRQAGLAAATFRHAVLREDLGGEAGIGRHLEGVGERGRPRPHPVADHQLHRLVGVRICALSAGGIGCGAVAMLRLFASVTEVTRRWPTTPTRLWAAAEGLPGSSRTPWPSRRGQARSGHNQSVQFHVLLPARSVG